jgi:hypothetical protein
VVVVAGRRVDPRVGADVPWSQAPVTIVVTVPGGQYDPWTGLIVPTADGPVRPELRLRPPATAGAGSSGSSPAVPQGPDGGTTRAGGPAGADAGSVASSTQPPRTGTSSADAGDGRPTGRLGTSIMTQWGD